MTQIFKKFWDWYERHETVNLGIAAGLFLWQLIHLYWLTTDVVFSRLFGKSFFDPSATWEWVLIVVDYTEIPALLATSLVYINKLRKNYSTKSLLFLIFINSQWLHLFWITDEFVLDKLAGVQVAMPMWLAWVAILIDYLEAPVIYDTTKRFFQRLKK